MDQSQKELLISSGVDLTGALERFMDNEKLYESYLRKFSENPHFAKLSDAFAQENWQDALAISHNLKGVTGSLGFTALYELLVSQVALLRQDSNEEARALMDDIMTEYQRLLPIAQKIV